VSAKAKKISGKRILQGKLLCLDVDQVIEPHGDSPVRREVVRHPQAVAVVPCLPGAKLLLVRQYRYAPDEYLWEIPAGILESGEKPQECAARELEEETGYAPGRLTPIARLHSSPGFTDELIHLYRAEELTPATASPDPEEHLEIKIFELGEVLDMISQGRITDAKTVSGILLVARDFRSSAASEPPRTKK